MLLAPVLTTFALLQVVASQQDNPFCLQTCLTEVGTTLCAENALRQLTPCLSKTCPNPPATQNLIASLDVAFTPKAEYSCQQAYGPSNPETEGSSVTLPLNGTCATSPYGFKSFLPQGVSRIRASNGCRVMVFSEEDCLGEEASSDVGALRNGQCVFRGGRSARLTCRNELDGMVHAVPVIDSITSCSPACATTAARAYIQSECGNDADDEPDTESDDSSSSSTPVYPSSAPYHGPGPTSSGVSTSTSIPFHWPFSSNTGSSTQSASTNSADAAAGSGTSGDEITHTLTLPSALPTGNGSAPGNGAGGIVSIPAGASLNATQTSTTYASSQNGTLTLTLSAMPTADTTALPSFTGVAARLGGGTSVALAVVGAVFAMFL